MGQGRIVAQDHERQNGNRSIWQRIYRPLWTSQLRRALLRDYSDEAVTSTRHGLDEAWLLCGVVQRGSQLVNALGERALGDNDVAPDFVEQYLLGLQPASVRNQMDKQVEGLRLQCHAYRNRDTLIRTASR